MERLIFLVIIITIIILFRVIIRKNAKNNHLKLRLAILLHADINADNARGVREIIDEMSTKAFLQFNSCFAKQMPNYFKRIIKTEGAAIILRQFIWFMQEELGSNDKKFLLYNRMNEAINGSHLKDLVEIMCESVLNLDFPGKSLLLKNNIINCYKGAHFEKFIIALEESINTKKKNSAKTNEELILLQAELIRLRRQYLD